jgi:hypothetical protein
MVTSKLVLPLSFLRQRTFCFVRCVRFRSLTHSTKIGLITQLIDNQPVKNSYEISTYMWIIKQCMAEVIHSVMFSATFLVIVLCLRSGEPDRGLDS